MVLVGAFFLLYTPLLYNMYAWLHSQCLLRTQCGAARRGRNALLSSPRVGARIVRRQLIAVGNPFCHVEPHKSSPNSASSLHMLMCLLLLDLHCYPRTSVRRAAV